MHPQEYICLSEGIHLRLSTDEQNVFAYILFQNIYTCQWIFFSKIITCLLLNISMHNHDKMYCHGKFQRCLCVCQNAEGVHTYLLKCWRGTCSSFGMLKGYMVKERLVTPVLKQNHKPLRSVLFRDGTYLWVTQKRCFGNLMVQPN